MSPPLEVEEGVEGVPVPMVGIPVTLEEGVEGVPVPVVGVPVTLEEGVLGRERTGGTLGVASGSLPAAFARVGLNILSYIQPVRHV